MENTRNPSTENLVQALRNFFSCFPLPLRRNLSTADDLESGLSNDHAPSPEQGHTWPYHAEPQPDLRYHHNRSSTSSPLEHPSVAPRAVIGESHREITRFSVSRNGNGEAMRESPSAPMDLYRDGFPDSSQPSSSSSSSHPAPAPDSGNTTNNNNTPPFVIPQRHLLTIAALFGHPEVPQRPHTLGWGDFKYTMAYFGFVIDGSGGGGSRFKFKPTKLSLYISPERRGSSFTVHRPHGGAHEDRIPRATLQGIGRELTRLYGWSAEMFTGE